MVDDKKIKLLESANIKIEDCYITDDDRIFTPLYDKDFNIIKTGLEVYNEFNNPTE